MPDARIEFLEWFHGLEGFHLLSERFYEDMHVSASLDPTQRAALMVKWLEAAFEAGQHSRQFRSPGESG